MVALFDHHLFHNLGKGPSIWDIWPKNEPSVIKDRSNGDIACDSYHKYKEDVQLLKNLGVIFKNFTKILFLYLDNYHVRNTNLGTRHHGLQ